jgi:hypothetical protein
VIRAVLEKVHVPGLRHDWPPTGGWWQRRVVIGVGSAFLLLTLIVVWLFAGGGHRHVGRAPAATAPPASTSPAPVYPGSSPGDGLSWHSPSTLTPAVTPIQEQYDQAFAQGLGQQPGMATAESLVVPAPAVTGGWPHLAVEVTPESWAQAFVSSLLNVDYPHQSRSALAQWLAANEAPELIPGVPPSLADKVLFVSLLDPGLFGGQPTPIPSTHQWAVYARAGTVQSVSDLIVQADPNWSQTVAAGWQPTDVRMTEEDLSGVLNLRHGAVVISRHFSLAVIVGSARWHDGYGTVAVSSWAEQ